MAATLRFNTSFLLKATTVTSLCCLPLALDRQDGLLWTAILTPIGLATLVVVQIKKQGEYAVHIKRLAGDDYEIKTTGGDQSQGELRARVMGAGACLSFLCGVLAARMMFRGSGLQLSTFLITMALLILLSTCVWTRRYIVTSPRRLVTTYLLFGHLVLWRRHWDTREGDFLAVFPMQYGEKSGDNDPTSQYHHTLFLCRGRRRRAAAIAVFPSKKANAGMQTTGRRVAELLGVPFEGQRESRGIWWPW